MSNGFFFAVLSLTLNIAILLRFVGGQRERWRWETGVGRNAPCERPKQLGRK